MAASEPKIVVGFRHFFHPRVARVLVLQKWNRLFSRNRGLFVRVVVPLCLRILLHMSLGTVKMPSNTAREVLSFFLKLFWLLTDNIVNGLLCNSYFLDEQEWMGNCSEPEGKLYCPKCNFRVGSFCWAGSQCSCGRWCTPSFQVPKSRVDEKVVTVTAEVL